MSSRNGDNTARHQRLRPDLRLIADMVRPGTRVLDLGCGDGALLDYLVHAKGVDGRGMELSQAGVNACVEHGLSVIQGDADLDLKDYPSDAFDCVILSQTLQATSDPKGVLAQMVRIGRRAIVSFPNFGWWRVRLHLLVCGSMPVTDALHHEWYDTPNIHLCTIRDFVTLCERVHIGIDQSVSISERGKARRFRASSRLANLFSEQAIFLLKRG
ncbi:MAG: methionine biosynthesis protein MetW [Alphaproteobacteria bacterium]